MERDNTVLSVLILYTGRKITLMDPFRFVVPFPADQEVMGQNRVREKMITQNLIDNKLSFRNGCGGLHQSQ